MISTEELQWKYANVRMIIDRSKYPEEEVPTANHVYVHSNLKKVLDKLVKKHPTMDFKIDVIGKSPQASASRITIFFQGEELAHFAWRIYDEVFRIEGFRVAEVRTRKEHIETKDVGRAVTQLNKILRATSTVETVSQTVSNLLRGINNIQWAEKNKADNVFKYLFNVDAHRRDLMVQHRHAIAEILGTVESDAEHLLGADEIIEAAAAAQGIYNSFYGVGLGYSVTFKGGYYIVGVINSGMVDGEEVAQYKEGYQPAFVKRAVGMLKLTEDNTLIGNIGYKYKRDSYFIVKPLVEVQDE